MLGPQYPDLKVREYAVHCLRLMSDSELVDLLPILIQSLKHETYHHSSLGNFLLDRALNNKAYVGHFFFWHLHVLFFFNFFFFQFILTPIENF